MQTAQSIMELLENDVSSNKPISPAKWCEAALRVNALAGEIDNQVAHYEATMNKIEAEYIKTDMPATKAKVLAKSEVNFEEYLKLKAILNRIGEFLSLARKRSQINEFYRFHLAVYLCQGFGSIQIQIYTSQNLHLRLSTKPTQPTQPT